MSADDPEIGSDRALVARRWVAVADRDIRSAYACLDAQEPIPEAATYHCQQAAEKLTKGLLVLAQVPFRRTHDLEALRDLVVTRFPDLRTSIDLLVPLTDWGLVFRYPDMGDEPVPSADQLRSALLEIRHFASLVVSRINAATPPASTSEAQR